jgi:preprotein translocase subunit SecF
MRIRDAISTFRGHRVPNFNIVDRKWWGFGLSGVFILLSLTGLVASGLNYSIDFKGGSVLQFPDRSGASVGDFQAVLDQFGLHDYEVEIIGGGTVNIRTESLTNLGLFTNPVPGASGSPSPAPSGSVSPSSSPSPKASASPEPSASATPTASASASPASSPTPFGTGIPTPKGDLLRAALAAKAGISPDEINETDVGPTWGATISRKAITGLIFFLILVTLYITFRFEFKMAAGALIALGHDIIITAGIYALVGRQVTPETVIAILTILGYSLYDTVVIYDKVKENTEQSSLIARDGYGGVVNLSLNQTFMRSVNTSLVVLLPIGALLLFGGPTLKDFAFALFVGVASGAYSSIFIAAPVLALFKEREPRYQDIRRRALARAARPGLRTAATRGTVSAGVGGDGEIGSEASAAAVPRRQTTSGGAPRPRPAGSSAARKKKGKPQAKAKRRRR